MIKKLKIKCKISLLDNSPIMQENNEFAEINIFSNTIKTVGDQKKLIENFIRKKPKEIIIESAREMFIDLSTNVKDVFFGYSILPSCEKIILIFDNPKAYPVYDHDKIFDWFAFRYFKDNIIELLNNNKNLVIEVIHESGLHNNTKNYYWFFKVFLILNNYKNFKNRFILNGFSESKAKEILKIKRL